MNPKRLGFQVVDVHFGTFDFTLHVIVGPLTHVKKYVRWKMCEPAYDARLENHLGLTFIRDGRPAIVWLPRRPRTAKELGTLVHEVMHVVRAMLTDWVGMKLSDETDEVYAHAMGFAVGEILTGLSR